MVSPVLGVRLSTVLTTATSTAKLTLTVAEETLFAEIGSGSVAVAVAVLVIGPTVFTVAIICNNTLCPFGTDPTLQTPVAALYVPREAEAFTNVIPAGMASATVTLVASFGPLFFSAMVNVTRSPILGASASTVLRISRSALVTERMVATEVLFAGIGSGSVPLMMAVVVMAPVCPTVVVINKVSACPAAKAPIVHCPFWY